MTRPRRTTSAETAAAFLARRARRELGLRPHVGHEPRPLPERLQIDFARATVEELLACVNAKLRHHERRGTEAPWITEIAGRMLREALGRTSG